MNKIKKGMAMVMAYLLLISILPVGFFTTIAKAEGGVPKYLNYNDLYITSLAQYGDKTLVAYNVDESQNYGDLNYGVINGRMNQLSLFENGKEKKIDQYKELYLNNYKLDFSNMYVVKDYNYGSKYEKYDFLTGTLSPVTIGLNNDVKLDIVDKINQKYNTNYSIQKSTFNYSGNLSDRYDCNGNKYSYVQFYQEGEQNYTNDSIAVVYNKSNTYITKITSRFNVTFDNENNLVIYNYTDQKIIKMKNNEVVSEVQFKCSDEESYMFTFGNKAYTLGHKDNDLKEYVLENGEYKYSKIIATGINYANLTQDSKKNIWFLLNKDGGNFIFKVENGEAVKKYEVASDMDRLYVYDDNNVVVTSAYGSTIINAGSTYDPGTVETKPVIENKDNTTNVVVPQLTQGVTNTINISNEQKEVVVNLNDIATIKSGNGSALIQLSNGTKINIPFSLIDKALLEGATNVQVKYNTIENSDLIKGIKGVKKVFDFNLQIEYADKSIKSIHKFADGTAEITLALTDEDLKGLDKNKLKVLYYNEETKKYEVLETTVNGNNVTFKTSHFSKFIVAEVDNDGQPVKTTTDASKVKTGDTNTSRNIIFIVTFALLSLGVVVTMGHSKLKKNK